MPSIRILFALIVGSALPAPALALDLPVRVPGQAGGVPAPAYLGDVLELRLSPAAAPAGFSRAAGLARVDALGVAGVDRLSATLGGVWFEPEFRGETPPPAGSDEPDFTAFYVAHLPAGVPLEDALARFRGLGEVASADPIAVLPVDAIPNDSLWTSSWWLYQPATRRDIHAPEAWDVSLGDTAVVVAILDTGVIPYHPDIGGSVAGLPGQIWTNWAEAVGTPGVDDDGNGFVDDIHGWDFVNLGAFPDTLAGEDGEIEDPDPNDYAGHGTAVAGLVGAITDNVIGMAGVARKVRLMPLRMGWASSFSPSGEVRMDFAAKAIRYATRMGAQVINCSWASLNMSGLDAAIGAAARAGVTVVSASGNNGEPHYVGDRDDALAIAASDATDTVAPFSNTGPFVDLTAPGVAMSSTWIVRPGADSLGLRQPAYRGALNGTSFSAPLTAGVAALIQARYVWPYSYHLLTPRGVQLRLMETADDISAQNPGLAGLYGAGRLNAYRALTEITGSTATRTRARSVGAPVLVPSNQNMRAAFLTTNRLLLQIDVVSQDSVMVQNTFGVPTGHLAAADLGPPVGTALFYATTDQGVFGFEARNALLPGTWPQPGSAPLPMSGPALGDVDGDGAVEIVSGGDDGQLWAWHADGSDAAGFPIPTGSSPLRVGPALSDLDGALGVEVIVAAIDGMVHAYATGGAELSGWPVTVAANPRAPVVMRLGSSTSPSVVVAAGNQLHAFSPAGIERPGFPVTLAGNATQDPAVADMDGDGFDDIIVATFSQSSLEVRDSSGVSLSALGWPRPLSGAPQGGPVAGELSTSSPGPELLIMRGASLLALEHDGDSLASFPKPGGAGAFPSLGQADGDAAAEVLAGTGSDSLFYIYDAGPGSAGAGAMPWPTARGNFARTGSRLYAPALGSIDAVPPATIADLRAGTVTATSIELLWSAPADDGPLGRASAYEIRRALFPLTDANFSSGTLVAGAPVPRAPALAESLVVPGLAENTTWYFGIRSTDASGNTSPMSNLLQTTTLAGAPAPVTDLRVTARTDSSISLAWTATGDDGMIGRPRVYAVRAGLQPLDEASFVTAPLQRVVSATVDAGGTERLLFRGLAAATAYWFALKAVDDANNPSLLSNVVATQTEVGGPLAGRSGAALAALEQPSRGSALFYWQASADGVSGRQLIQIYDVTGRRLRVLDVGAGVGGKAKWDGRDAEGRSVPAGLYYARLLSGSIHTQTRLVLLP
jgi:subtilisin family serine protease/chitodextrinase